MNWGLSHFQGLWKWMWVIVTDAEHTTGRNVSSAFNPSPKRAERAAQLELSGTQTCNLSLKHHEKQGQTITSGRFPWCYRFYLITWQLHGGGGGGGWGGTPVTRGGVWPKWKSGGSWSWRLASNDRGCNDTQMLNDCLPCDFVFSCPLSFRTMACNHVIYCCSCDVEQKRRTTLWAHSPAAAIPGYSYSWPLRSLFLPPVSVTFTLCC